VDGKLEFLSAYPLVGCITCTLYSSIMSAPLSIADLARLSDDIVLTPPEPRMSLLHANIEYKGFGSPPTFLTKPSNIAGYGINIAKMGNPFPLQPTDKLSVPLQPDEELIDALTKLAGAVARQVEKDRAKVRYLRPTLGFATIPNLPTHSLPFLCRTVEAQC